MAKICIPRYGKGKFESLRDAYEQLKKDSYGWESYVFKDLVQYNIIYRDVLRTSGLDALKDVMIHEVPELRNEQEIFKNLEKACRNGNYLADYDIQCYDIHDPITIMGHTFNGLEDVQTHVEKSATPSMDSLFMYTRDNTTPYPDIHIGELYDDYPKFDSFDDCDDRTYQNYFFRKHVIVADDVYETSHIDKYSNFCMIHEEIPQGMLPILYYKGDGDYMLLASEKLKTLESNNRSLFKRMIKILGL